MIPREQFFSIPFAPRYEVNGYFIVRNSATKHVIQPLKTGVVTFFYEGYRFRQRPESYYRRARAAAEDEEWRPVPSLDGKYELNPAGNLRNATTKVPLKKREARGSFYYLIKHNGHPKNIYLGQLLNETYGIESKPLPSRKCNVGVQITNGSEQHYFATTVDCANFLAARVFYTVGYIKHFLRRRCIDLWGWHATYFEPEKAL